MRISDWSSDVCSSDLLHEAGLAHHAFGHHAAGKCEYLRLAFECRRLALAVHAVQKISERIAAEGIRIRVTGSAQPVELVATCGDHMAFVDALVTTWRAGLFHHSLQSLLEDRKSTRLNSSH